MKVKLGTKITVIDYNNWVKHSNPNRKLVLAVAGGSISCYAIECSDDGIIRVWVPEKGIISIAEDSFEFTFFTEDDLLNKFISLEESEEITNKVKAYLSEHLIFNLKRIDEAKAKVVQFTKLLGDM